MSAKHEVPRATSEKVFSRARISQQARQRAVSSEAHTFNNQLCETIPYRSLSIFIKTIRIHSFRKHPYKLEIRTLRFRAMHKNRECLPSHSARKRRTVCPHKELQAALFIVSPFIYISPKNP